MTNFEYIKTLPKNEMAKFIINNMTEVFDKVMNETILCWREDEARAVELKAWEKWLNEEHKDETERVN